MKIAYIVPALVNKGPIIVVNTIVKHLIDKVEKIDVYYFDDIGGLKFSCNTYQIKLGTSIDFDNYDIIHSHGYRPDKYVAKWRTKISKAVTVTTIHSDISYDLSCTFNPIVSFFYTRIWMNKIKKINVVTAISRMIMDTYKNQLDNLFLVYNGVDIEKSNLSSQDEIVDKIMELKKQGYTIVGTYANITKIKGLEQIISLLNLRNDLAAVIIGEGKEKENLIRLSKELNVSDRVYFADYLIKPYNYLAFCDIYLMCSRSEGFGLSIIEAALMQCPIVCSNIAVFHEIFNEKYVAYYELDDLLSLSKAIDGALESREIKNRKAMQYAIENFSGIKMAKNYLHLYEKVINIKK